MKRYLLKQCCSFIAVLPVIAFAIQEPAVSGGTIAYQKELISALTGKAAIDGGTTFLTQRSSPKERELTVQYLLGQLDKIGVSTSEHRYTTTNSNVFLDLFYAPVRGCNVVGELRATIKDRPYVILGAHYDTERGSPGAIDNATGIALLLAVVKKWARLKERRLNFKVVFFDQEEDDEIGSREYVKMLKKTGIEVHSVHVVDLIGWDADGDQTIALQSPPKKVADVYKTIGGQLGTAIEVFGGAASDNKSFLEHGYATVLVTDELEDMTPYYHSPNDVYDTVDFEYLALSSELVFRTLKALADE